MSEEPENIDNTDDFAESIETIPVRTKVIKVTNTARGEEIEKMLAQAIRQTDKNVFFEPSCPVCTNPHRKELEQKYQETAGKGSTPLLEVKKLAKDSYGVDFENAILENHFLMHLNSGVREQQKVEYSRIVKQLYNQSLTTLDRVSFGFAVIVERLSGINSLVPTHNESAADIERIKSVETTKLMGAWGNLLKLQAALLGEMKNNNKLISLPSDEFQSVFDEIITDAKTDSERKLIVRLLEKLTVLSAKAQ